MNELSSFIKIYNNLFGIETIVLKKKGKSVILII